MKYHWKNLCFACMSKPTTAVIGDKEGNRKIEKATWLNEKREGSLRLCLGMEKNDKFCQDLRKDEKSLIITNY